MHLGKLAAKCGLVAGITALGLAKPMCVCGQSGSTWPQPYSVQRDKGAGILSLRTPFYTIEHDLKKGGEISRITLTHGKAPSLVVQPADAGVRDEHGIWFSDLKDSAPKVTHRTRGLNEVVTVEAALRDPKGRSSGIRVHTTYEYRWGYIKVHREFLAAKDGLQLIEVCPFSAVLSPDLDQYGFREDRTEAEGASPFSFGSNRWGKLRPGDGTRSALDSRFLPRSLIFVNTGVEGLEWFAGSDLSQWATQLTGQRGQGRCRLGFTPDRRGIAVAISPLCTTNAPSALPRSFSFDFYIGFPLLEGHALKPWLHTSFNRNQGKWVSAEQIRKWTEQGIQTVHCHNDGDYYGDGLFWRDGSYPPYPDMDRYDEVLKECRSASIRTATYFSNKELHPSTKEFQEHGQDWGRMNGKGDLQHNFFRPQSEFGAQMCLRSGWLDFLEQSIDRVLQHSPLDGVYYDWNVALYCCNPRHEGKDATARAQGHWDIDELLSLMEWTRQRVGPTGLIIVHDTTTPMFATENFANAVVATEWGYRKWTNAAPDLDELPVEWSLAGARARGVISYGTIDSSAPSRLHRDFVLEAFLGGVTPWPASPATFELMAVFKPLGDIESYRFADWRNAAVSLSNRRCGSAVYSRKGEAYVLIANLDPVPQTPTVILHPEKLSYPLALPFVATRLSGAWESDPAAGGQANDRLDVTRLMKEGIPLTLPADGVALIHLQ